MAVTTLPQDYNFNETGCNHWDTNFEWYLEMEKRGNIYLLCIEMLLHTSTTTFHSMNPRDPPKGKGFFLTKANAQPLNLGIS